MNSRQERFCAEYMIDLNATQAALRAGYRPSTAQNARQWITEGKSREKPYVRARVERLLAESSKRSDARADRILLELAAVAFADASRLISSDGSLDLTADPETARAVAEIKASDTVTFIAMTDKLRALVLLGKHLGLFPEKARINAQMPQIVHSGSIPQFLPQFDCKTPQPDTTGCEEPRK